MDAHVRLRLKSGPKSVSASSENVNSSCVGYSSNEGDNIKVYVRIRPPLKQVHDSSVDTSLCLEVSSPSSLTIATKPEPKQFSFDHVSGMETTQEEVFATVGKGIIEAFVNGFNGTIFAYGQTGSGKTFTMLGPADDTDNFTHELRGVIPRGFEYLFSLINRQQEKSGDRAEFLARCSFLEIYNEQVFDLLDPSTTGLHLRENIQKGVFVDGLVERDINSAKDAYSVLQSGWLNRRVASTSMNRESSRSHAVFTVTLESKKRQGGMNNIKVSKLHLVDLAGSERQKDTHTQDVRLKEAGSINKSLSALGNVIMSLVDIAHGKTRHVHYRDSKLTFILRDSLGGNAKTYIIANVHPSSRCFGETLSTLNFARRAKMIKNKAVVNEDVTGNVSELQAEIRRLKEQLSQTKSGLTSSQEILSDKDKSTPVVGLQSNSGEWKEMMLGAIGERDQSEKEKCSLQEKVLKLEELCSKKEKFLQSTRMILKFRTDHIAKLERQLKKNTVNVEVEEEDSKEKEIKLLREEIKLLQTSLDHHPEVKRFAMENVELRAEVKRLQALDPSNGSITKTMAEKHRYTLQLERQLRDLISNNSTEESLSSSQQSIEASNAEVEKVKIELAQGQAKLHTSQNELKLSRESLQQSTEEVIALQETFRKKEIELQSDLAAVRKSNNELERTLETFQLKIAIERSAMNSLHMQTIKTLSSPIKFGSCKSTPRKNMLNGSKQSTPLKAKENNVKKSNPSICSEKYVNDPDRFIGDELPPEIMMHPKEKCDSFDEMSDDDENFNPYDMGFQNETHDEEIVYIEALQEEIKQLQDLYSQSIQKIYEEQRKKIPLDEMIAKLNHKSNTLETQLLNERKIWLDKESQLNIQIVSLRDKYKEFQGEATILKSEVDDLRIMLSSTEKQLDNMKKQKDDEVMEVNRKHGALDTKNIKLELDIFQLKTEVDKTAESNNNLLADFEQCKEELEFSHHKNKELEEIVRLERKKVKEKDEELNSISERLSFELENKVKLSQTDKEQELLHSVEVISELRDEIKQLSKEVDEQKNTIDELRMHAKSAAAAQQWKSLYDKEAVHNYITKIDEMKVMLSERDAVIKSTNAELEDVKQLCEDMQSSFVEKKEKIQKLSESLKLESDKLAKEKSEREKEVMSLQEEILLSQDQCKELRATLEEKQTHLQTLQNDVLQSKVELAQKTNTITSLEVQLSSVDTKVTIDVNTSDVLTGDDTTTCEDRDNITALSEKWQTLQEHYNLEIKDLKRRCSEFEVIEHPTAVYEHRISTLEAVVVDLEEEKKELLAKEQILQVKISDLSKVKCEYVEKMKILSEEKERCVSDSNKLNQQICCLKMNLCNLQDDLDYHIEELEKTKILEESNFNEMNVLKSKLEITSEEKKRLHKQIDELSKSNEKLQLDHAKITGHQNHNQRIQYHMNLKKDNLTLQEELRKARLQLKERDDA